MAEQNAFQELIELLNQLTGQFNAYDRTIAAIEKEAASSEERILEEYAAKEARSDALLQQQTRDTQKRKEDWADKIRRSIKHAEYLLEEMGMEIGRAVSGLDTVSKDNIPDYIQSMNAESQTLKKRGRKDDNAEILRLYQDASEMLKNLRHAAQELMQTTQAQYDQETALTKKRDCTDRENSLNVRDQDLRKTRERRTTRLAQTNDGFVNLVEQQLKPDEKTHLARKLLYDIPAHDSFQPAKAFPEGICFGYAAQDVTNQLGSEIKRMTLQKRFSSMIDKRDGKTYMMVPFGYSFTDPRFSTLFEFEPNSRQEAVENLRALVMRILMTVPCGKAHFTFIDPIDLGSTFSLFSPLGDVDERIIDTAIWSDEERIEERLQLIVNRMSDIIQRCRQGKYSNIIEYNKAAGKNAEPLRFLVIMDFPNHFSDEALKSLESIIKNGVINGVYTLIAAEKESVCGGKMEKMFETMNRFPCSGGISCTSDIIDGKPLRFMQMPKDEKEKTERTIDLLKRGIKESEKIIITYDDISDNLLEHPEKWFRYSAENGICIPIGMEGANKTIELCLGGVNQGGKKRPFHAMVAGNIGSGKSTLLHTMIIGMLLHYDPEDVQMYLLDFKRGIEFKDYATADLRNFRVVSIESEPEFGLAVLRAIEQEENRRSACFREMGVDRIEAYREVMARRGVLHHGMPRLLVIFDEYQEMFYSTDDPIVTECARLLTKIVLQAGSAMGIHVILATQDTSNVKGLDPALYEQFETRVALKCNEATSRVILSDDNEGCNKLVTADAGQAIFNEACGHRDYNHNIRIAYNGPDERKRILGMIHDAQQEMEDIQRPPVRLLLSSVQDAAYNALTRFAEMGEIPKEYMPSLATSLYIGESLAMANTFKPQLWNRDEQNVLIAGTDQNRARLAFGHIAMSMLYETIRMEGEINRKLIYLFDFGSKDEIVANEQNMVEDLLAETVEGVPEAFEVFGRDQMLSGLALLYEELTRRRNGEPGEQMYVMFFGLNRARRLLASTNAYEQSPKEMLAELLLYGPANGMNFIVWANNPSLYLDHFGETLQSFQHRIVFGMEEDEYRTIVCDRMPKHEGEFNALAFNLDDDNQKIRLYNAPTATWLDRFISRCREYLR